MSSTDFLQFSNDDIKEVIACKRSILSSKKLFEATAQVPSPSKDFCQLLITEKGVVWRKWKISLRNHSQGTAPMPTENIMSYEDFRYDKSLQYEIELTFGSKALRQMLQIISGCNDSLSSLPEDITITMMTYLDLQSIAYLSQVNQHFREVCNSDTLWSRLYLIHQGRPNQEITTLAKETSWKRVFFMNKLQLQKEISRRRRHLSPQSSTSSATGTTTFLTQQIED